MTDQITVEQDFAFRTQFGYLGLGTACKLFQAIQIIFKIINATIYGGIPCLWTGIQTKFPNSILGAPLPTVGH